MQFPTKSLHLLYRFILLPTVQFSNLAHFYVYLTLILLSKINLYHRFKLWSRSAKFSDDLQIWNDQIVQNCALFQLSSCRDCFNSWNRQFQLLKLHLSAGIFLTKRHNKNKCLAPSLKIALWAYTKACFSFTFTCENKQNSVNFFMTNIFIILREKNSLVGLIIKGCPIQIVGPLHFHSSLGFGKVVSMCWAILIFLGEIRVFHRWFWRQNWFS